MKKQNNNVHVAKPSSEVDRVQATSQFKKKIVLSTVRKGERECERAKEREKEREKKKKRKRRAHLHTSTYMKHVHEPYVEFTLTFRLNLQLVPWYQSVTRESAISF